jgi:FkbM family methyltransferase
VPFVPRLTRAIQSLDRFSNPLEILLKRSFGRPGDIMEIRDRRSGTRCRCTVGSFHMFAGIWYSGEYDVPRIPIRPGDIVLDIGANQGFFACYAAHKGARVFAFEPNPDSFARLQQNVERNNLAGLVVAQPWAISGRTGETQLMISDDLGGGMSTIVPGFASEARLSVSARLDVPCFTLSEILDRLSLSRVRLCKIDAEGAELDILRALPPTRAISFESLVVEVHPQGYPPRELLDLLISWGTHQVSFNEERGFSSNILRLASTQALLESL